MLSYTSADVYCIACFMNFSSRVWHILHHTALFLHLLLVGAGPQLTLHMSRWNGSLVITVIWRTKYRCRTAVVLFCIHKEINLTNLSEGSVATQKFSPL